MRRVRPKRGPLALTICHGDGSACAGSEDGLRRVVDAGFRVQGDGPGRGENTSTQVKRHFGTRGSLRQVCRAGVYGEGSKPSRPSDPGADPDEPAPPDSTRTRPTTSLSCAAGCANAGSPRAPAKASSRAKTGQTPLGDRTQHRLAVRLPPPDRPLRHLVRCHPDCACLVRHRVPSGGGRLWWHVRPRPAVRPRPGVSDLS